MTQDFIVEGDLIAEQGKIGRNKTNLHSIPDVASDEIILAAATQTISGKTISTASNTITTTPAGNLVSTDLDSALAELQLDVDGRILTTQKGVANGVAGLDANGHVPIANLNPTVLDSAVFTTFTSSGTISTQTGTLRWYAPRTIIFSTWEAWVSTPPTGASINCRIKKNGVIQGDLIVIADGAYTGSGSIAAPWQITAGEYITVDIDQVGPTVAGADLNVRLGGV